MLGFVAATVCVGLVFAGFLLKQSDFVDAAVIETWRSKLSEQDDVVEQLREQSIARRQAVGRQIAEMQSRLWRMEALASYMHETSGLPKDEFDFDAPVSQDLRTRYGHHEEVLVHAGQSVKRGDVIALMGSSGRSTGPHVHFEVLKEGRPVNPARYVSAVAQ